MKYIPLILLSTGVFMGGLGLLIAALRRPPRTLNHDLFQK